MSKNVWKYNNAGVLQWTAWTGDTARHMTVDVAGNVYVAGHRAGGKSVWKYDSDGNEIQSYDTGSATRGVSIDKDGNVWVVGAEVANKSIWKLDADLTFILSIDNEGHSYCVDCFKNHVYVGSPAQGATTYNLRKYKLDGTFVWGLQVSLALPAVYCIKVVNHIYVGLTDGPGVLQKISRNGLWLGYDGHMAACYGLDVIPHRAIARETGGKRYFQKIIDTDDGDKLKSMHIRPVVLFGGVIDTVFYGVQMCDTKVVPIDQLDYYGECKNPLGGYAHNIMSITAGHNNKYFVVGITDNHPLLNPPLFYKIDLCLHCVGDLCIPDWSKTHYVFPDTRITYGTAVDIDGNCYCCGTEDTT